MLQLRDARNSFIEGRVPISDADFATAIGVPQLDLHRAAAIRRTIGKLCGIPSELIRPEDKPEQIASMVEYKGQRGWDDLAFVLALEESTGIVLHSLPRFLPGRLFLWRMPAPCDFGHWVKEAVDSI